MIYLILSPDINANEKLALKISKELNLFKINVNDINDINDINLYLKNYKSFIIYGQYDNYIDIIMNSQLYQLIIHDLKTEEIIIKETLEKYNYLDNNSLSFKITKKVNKYYFKVLPYLELNQLHLKKRYDSAIV
jgi:hypothetical protein